jgi:hypothetical protein
MEDHENPEFLFLIVADYRSSLQGLSRGLSTAAGIEYLGPHE